MTVYTPPIHRVNGGRGHRYEDANGLRVPGVTTIISGGIPKPALVDWASNVTADYAVDHWDELGKLAPSARLKTLQKAKYADRDTAANRGTAVHRLAEKLVLGEKVQVPDEIRGHVESYVRFLDDFDVEPILTEFVVMSHEHAYAGTGDLLADLRRLETRALLDVKTSRSGIFGETALQLSGYRYADTYVDVYGDEQPMLEVDWCGAVHVRADGYSLIPVEAGEEQHRAFLYAAQVADFVANSRDLIGEPVEPPTASTYHLTRIED
jgi:hypothetical protein